MQQQHRFLVGNDIRHLAVIIRNISTGEVMAYHGNILNDSTLDGKDNDMAQAKRSSGSILKPFLFAAALDEGLIHPQSLLPDIPSWMSGFHPKNFDESYSGAIQASEALRRSLNVPFVALLQQFGTPRFHQLLQDLGFSTFTQTPSHYGLSLILGGGEINLWELSLVYSKFAQQLLPATANESFPLSRGSIYLTTEALRQLNRPETESGWLFGEDKLRMAWKTGTSYGFRDAWAVGYTPDYCIAVWAGNADGHGRPGLTGIGAAAPLLFDIALSLDNGKWFDIPASELQEQEVCAQSGYPPGPFCDSIILRLALLQKRNLIQPCNYHQLIRTDNQQHYSFPAGCQPAGIVQTHSWFVLPPVMEYYYKQKHLSYKPVPPVYPFCNASQPLMDFIYPPKGTIIYQPADYAGQIVPIVFELIHQQNGARVFWHLNDKYLGETTGSRHQMRVTELAAGTYRLVAVDESGNSIGRNFRLEKR